jgi:hypothetical protein
MNIKRKATNLAGCLAAKPTSASTASTSTSQADRRQSRRVNILPITQAQNTKEAHSHQHPDISELSSSDLLAGLNSNQILVLKFIIMNLKRIISYDQISIQVKIPRGTVRGNVKTLTHLGFIRPYPKRTGKIQGLSFKFNIKLCKLFCEVHGLEFPPSLIDTSYVQTTSTPTPPPCDQIERSTYTIKEKIMALTADDISRRYPKLAAHGLCPNQIRQFVSTLEKNDFSLTNLLPSLDHLNWELENGTLIDGTGKIVVKPLGYFYNSIAQNGYYRSPNGYVSPEDQIIFDQKNSAHAAKQAYDSAANDLFQLWMNSLESSEKEKILEKKFGPEVQYLRHYWNENHKESMMLNHKKILSKIISEFSELKRKTETPKT